MSSTKPVLNLSEITVSQLDNIEIENKSAGRIFGGRRFRCVFTPSAVSGEDSAPVPVYSKEFVFKDLLTRIRKMEKKAEKNSALNDLESINRFLDKLNAAESGGIDSHEARGAWDKFCTWIRRIGDRGSHIEKINDLKGKITQKIDEIQPAAPNTGNGTPVGDGDGAAATHLSTNPVSTDTNPVPITTTPAPITSDYINRLMESKVYNISQITGAYKLKYFPSNNLENLKAYGSSEEYKRHAKTARIYYNSTQLAEEDAIKIIFQREPTNIAMGLDSDGKLEVQYDEAQVEHLFGYKKGVYIDADARKADGSLFKDLPNTAAVYSETYMWDSPGSPYRVEIACLSLPAPALDVPKQPHNAYYRDSYMSLDTDKYRDEMAFLFRTIEQAVKDNKDSAFESKGIQRLVLSRFGQNSFLRALSDSDQAAAKNIYKEQMAAFLDRIKPLNLTVVMSEYIKPNDNDIWLDDMILGDIIKTAKAGDLIVNPWDPNSAPGNGNDGDPTFDGAMGKASGILLTQTSWINTNLRSPDSLVAVI